MQTKLYTGDFVKKADKIRGWGFIDAIVTSPDYNLGVSHRRRKRREYLEWTAAWARKAAYLLSDRGSLFVNFGYSPSDPLWPLEVAQAIEQATEFQVQNVIHWVKSISMVDPWLGQPTERSIGHFKPINSKRYLNGCHEYIFHFTADGNLPLDRKAVGVPYQDKSNIDRWGHSDGRDLRCRGDVWFIPYPTIQSRDDHRPHPATFPVKLPEMCLTLRGLDRTRSVLDPFSGMGTTGVAAAQLGMAIYYGFDLVKRWNDEARRRIAAAKRTLKR